MHWNDIFRDWIVRLRHKRNEIFRILRKLQWIFTWINRLRVCDSVSYRISNVNTVIPDRILYVIHDNSLQLKIYIVNLLDHEITTSSVEIQKTFHFFFRYPIVNVNLWPISFTIQPKGNITLLFPSS